MDSERRRQWREESARTRETRPPAAADGRADETVGNGNAAETNDAARQDVPPPLRTEDWHLLVRLPDRPSEKDLRHLPGTVLAALLWANGISVPDGCNRRGRLDGDRVLAGAAPGAAAGASLGAPSARSKPAARETLGSPSPVPVVRRHD